ncbi:hypothetical protein [Bradyrhizobium sp. LA7.1]|uniref:hypothetical protein n=1 Tax=Bradyrhizobium sp. LA7.1 TaxID=3156324 RepID=UPI00339B3935
MARARTFGDSLAQAMALDADAGTEHHGDAVICAMLGRVASTRMGTLAKSNDASKVTRPDSGPQAPRSGGGQGVGGIGSKKAPTPLLAKSRMAASPAQPKKPQPRRRAWTSAQVAAALDDGVKRGHISGTQALAAMKAFEGKR